MSLVYTWEKLYLAVGELCGPESQSTRLANATTRYLVHLRPDDLPAELKREFIQLMSDLKAFGVHGEETDIQAAIGSLDASDREQATRKIVHIFSLVCRHLGV